MVRSRCAFAFFALLCCPSPAFAGDLTVEVFDHQLGAGPRPTSIVTFPDRDQDYSEVILILQSFNPCEMGVDGDEWDRTAYIYVQEEDDNLIQIARWLTPYWGTLNGDEDTLTLYLDGVSLDSQTLAWAGRLDMQQGGRTAMGVQLAPDTEVVETTTMEGSLDDVRIYNYVLDADEVADIFVGGPAMVPSPFDDQRNVDIETPLSWVAGASALSHNVYLGLDRDAVARRTAPTPPRASACGCCSCRSCRAVAARLKPA